MPDFKRAPRAFAPDASPEPRPDGQGAPIPAPPSSARTAPAPAPASVPAPAPSPASAPLSTPSLAVPRTLVHAFLSLKTTQARIRQVAVHRLGGKNAPPDRVDEVVQSANERALATTSLPGAPEQLRPWVSAVARSAAVDFLRRHAVHDARFSGTLDIEELPPDPIDAPDEEEDAEPEPDPGDDTNVEWSGARSRPKRERFLIGPWLKAEVEKSRGHREQGRMMLEMLRYKGQRPGSTDAQVAATFGLTLAAYESRYRRFRRRYVPLRRRYTERRNGVILLLLLLVGVIALVVGMFWPRAGVLIGPDRSTVPVPSASASAEPRLNQAAPTEEDDARPPQPQQKPQK
jgi:DNA-directed RNA polymerase specialized sigma24 family protein